MADVCCVISVVAGTVGPIGFLGLQLSYGLNVLFGVPDSFATQSRLILLPVSIYTISAITGLERGIRFRSRWNLILAFGHLVFILLFGPTWAILSGFLGGLEVYLQNFAGMAFYRGETGLFGEPGWLGWWTVFFWGWFLGYGPMMAIFVARVSRGRTNRQIILLLSILAAPMTDAVSQPVLLAPFLAHAGARVGHAILLSCEGLALSLDAGQPDMSALATLEKITAAPVTLSPSASAPCPSMPMQPAAVSAAAIAALETYALRTTVPATDASRPRAGANSNDND